MTAKGTPLLVALAVMVIITICLAYTAAGVHVTNVNTHVVNEIIAVPTEITAFIGLGTTEKDPERKDATVSGPQDETDSLRVVIANFSGVEDNHPVAEETTWGELRGRLTRFEIRETKGGPLWSPVSYKPGTTRGNANVEAVSVAVMDVDEGTDPGFIAQKLSGTFDFVVHSTFSSTPEKPKFRVAVPLGKPCPAEKWPEIWQRLNDLIADGRGDRQTKDPARAFFLPTSPPGGKTFTYSGRGRAVFPDDIPPPTPAEKTASANRPPPTDIEEILHRVEGQDAEGPLDRLLLETTPAEPRNHSSNLYLAWKLHKAGATDGQIAQLVAWPESEVRSTRSHFETEGAYSYSLETLRREDPIFAAVEEELLRSASDGAAQHAARALLRWASMPNATTARGTVPLLFTDLIGETFGRDLLYDSQAGKWRVFDGTIWPEDQSGRVIEMAEETLARMDRLTAPLSKPVRDWFKDWEKKGGAEKAAAPPSPVRWADDQEWRQIAFACRLIENFRAAQSNRRSITDALEILRSRSGMAVDGSEFNRDRWSLPCLEGVIDLRTGVSRPYQRGDRWTWKSPFHPKEGPHPKFDSFMHKFSSQPDPATGELAPDDNVLEYDRRVGYYILTGDVSEHFLGDYWGPGSNGKTTLLELVAGLIPEATVRADPHTFCDTRSDRIPNDLARCRDARLILVPEPPRDLPLNMDLLHRFSGGDKVSARFLHREYFEFYPQGKIVYYGSEKVRIRDQSIATWRRFRFRKCVARFPAPGEEGNVAGYHSLLLREEGNAILHWFVGAARLFAEKGLAAPEAVVRSTEDFKAESDWLKEFTEDCIVEGPGLYVSRRDLLHALYGWASKNDETGLLSMTGKRLVPDLEKRGWVRSSGNANERGWKDRGLSPEGTTCLNMHDQHRTATVQQSIDSPEEPGGWVPSSSPRRRRRVGR